MINLRSKNHAETLLLKQPRADQDMVMRHFMKRIASDLGLEGLSLRHCDVTPWLDLSSLWCDAQQSLLGSGRAAAAGTCMNMGVLCGLRDSEKSWRGVARKAFLPDGVVNVIEALHARRQQSVLEMRIEAASPIAALAEQDAGGRDRL